MTSRSPSKFATVGRPFTHDLSSRNAVELRAATQALINGKWVPARSYPGPLSWRIKGAWMVLTGKADAVIWPAGQ